MGKGLNEPCGCGSGRKFKRCCLGTSDGRATAAPAQPELTGAEYQFEAGARRTPAGFVPQIIWKRQDASGQWSNELVLVRMAPSPDATATLRAAENDVRECVGSRGGAGVVATRMRERGYRQV